VVESGALLCDLILTRHGGGDRCTICPDHVGIFRQLEAARRPCATDRRGGGAAAGRQRVHRPVSVPQRKVALVPCAHGQAVLLLFRLSCARGRVPLLHGTAQGQFPGSGGDGGRASGGGSAAGGGRGGERSPAAGAAAGGGVAVSCGICPGVGTRTGTVSRGAEICAGAGAAGGAVPDETGERRATG